MKISKKLIVLLTLLAAAGAQAGSRKPIRDLYTPHQKAFFLTTASVEFVRPGLTIAVQSASIAADGTITAAYTLSDPSGLPLDSAGITTPGAVSLSFIAAAIPKGQEQYVSYITRAVTGTVIPTTSQPTNDVGGATVSNGNGQYTYTFKTKAAGFDPAATSTIGIYGSRDLSLYNLGLNYASTTFNFVPNGSSVVTTRDVIRDASCNRCHDQLSAHGGSRRGIALCVMCHTPQNVDPITGNSLDLKVMAHQIHMGAQLPSVVAGTPYTFVGYQNAVSDFSAVVDPADPRRCQVCHDQTTGAAQATLYATNPTRVACGSCHNNVNFVTGANHLAGAQPDDSRCSTCHTSQGTSDFDNSVVGAHVVPADSSLLSGLVATIKSVANTSAGSAPTVTFTLRDSKGNGVAPSSLGSGSLTMAGPTSDYGSAGFGVASTPGYVTESFTKTACTPDGTCVYTFTHPIPAGSTGTYAIAIEAIRTETLLPGARNQQTVTYGAANPVTYFSVDGSALLPRRTVVSQANCNQCHYSLSEHGTLRNNVAYCVMCHNALNSDAATRATSTSAADKSQPAQGIDFDLLVHRVHFGPNAVATGAKSPYVVIGYGGARYDLSHTLYPPLSPAGVAGDTRNCSMCHVGSTILNLPLGLSPALDPQGWINPNQAVANSCSGCHTSKSQAGHSLLNTSSQLGETCDICHAAGTVNPVDQVHAQY
jgi:OmcA/MtrC family decaheme c-type cytochrome